MQSVYFFLPAVFCAQPATSLKVPDAITGKNKKSPGERCEGVSALYTDGVVRILKIHRTSNPAVFIFLASAPLSARRILEARISQAYKN
jgi:hypothetical protein